MERRAAQATLLFSAAKNVVARKHWNSDGAFRGDDGFFT